MSIAEERDERGMGRRVAKNTVLLSVGQVIQAASMGIWTVLVARYVGPAAFGIYSYAYATLAILITVVSLGLDQLLTRDVAQQPQQSPRYLATFMVIRLVLVAIVLAGVFLSSHLTGNTAGRSAIALFVALNAAIMGLNTLLAATLNAHEAMNYTAIAQSANYVLTLSTGAVAIWLRQPFLVVLGLSVGASIVQLILSLHYAGRVHGRPVGAPWAQIMPAAATLGLLRTALPFTLLQLVSVLRTYAPAVLLQSLTHSDAAVGFFAAAQRIHVVTTIVPDMLLHAIFPAFSGSYARARDQFGQKFERAYRYVFFVTAPLALGMWLISPPLLNLLYGPQYAPAVLTLQILSVTLLGGVGWVMAPAMLAIGRQGAYAGIYLGTLGAAGVAGLWMIPQYGAAGAAAVLVAAKLLQDAIYSVLLFRWLRVPFPAAWIVKTTAATLLMALCAALLLPWVHFAVVGLVLAPAVYLGGHLALRTLTPDDLAYIGQLLPAGARQRLRRLPARPDAPEEDPRSSA